MSKFVCPYCIRDYSLRKVLYVCPDCNRTAKIRILDKEPIKCKCGKLAIQRKCPICGNEIPKTALETPNLPFSIVGVTNSGKTNYITVMLHELRKASGLRIAMDSQDKYTRDHQNENYKRIYEQHSIPDNNAGGEKTPQIWYIRNLLKKHGNYVPTYTFTIFDGAGEDHENNLDTSSSVCRYIIASKAIIIALDPLILSSIRKGNIVDPVIMRNSLGGSTGETKNAADVVNSLANYIKAAKGIKGEKLLSIPVAIVLTKFDTILSHKYFGSNALIKKSSLTIKDCKVNMGEIQEVNEEIRYWLQEIGEESFINALEANFKEFYFFGVSSYGEPPKDANSLSDHIRPHRVLDPILWLFKKAKFID